MLSTVSGAEGLLQFLHASFEMTWHGNVKILSTFFSKIMTTLIIHFSTLPKKTSTFPGIEYCSLRGSFIQISGEDATGKERKATTYET
jgi:hypothetical protein